jgi:hypothetical protein
LNDFIVLKLPLVAREEVNEGRRPFERERTWGDCGGENTAFVPFAPFVCDLNEVGLGNNMIGVEGCGVLIVTTESMERSELAEKRKGEKEGGLSCRRDSSKADSVLQPGAIGVVGVTRGDVDTDKMEGADSVSGKEFLITGLGLIVASSTAVE